MAGLINLIKQKLGYTAPVDYTTTRVQRKPVLEDPRQSFKSEITPKKVAERALVKARRNPDPEKRAKLVDIARKVGQTEIPDLGQMSREYFAPTSNLRARDIVREIGQTVGGLLSDPTFEKKLIDQGVNPTLAPTLASFTSNYGGSAGIIKKPVKKVIGSKLGRIFTSGKAGLENMGEAGSNLARKILAQRRDSDLLKGRLFAEVDDALRGLADQDRLAVTDVLDKGMTAATPAVGQAAQRVRKVLDTVADLAQRAKLEVKFEGGGSVPFKPRENYFPRIYNLDELAKAKNRHKYLQKLVDTGQAQNLAEADKLFETFLKGQGERRAGNLERPRILDLDEYEKDPIKALDQYLSSASERLSQVKHYGKKDELAKDLIDRVRLEDGDHRYAQEVFDLMVGNKRYDNPVVSGIRKFNTATKLDWALIANATQSVNTASKVGVLRTINSALKALGPKKGEARKFAIRSGSLTDSVIERETDSWGSVLSKIMGPFKKVEGFNRIVAADAGADFTKTLASRILKDPKDAYALRQLKGLGVDVEKLIARGEVAPEDILKGAYGTANKTQFNVDAIDVPPGWKTNVGKLLFQFKNFSFKQTQFVRDEVIKEMGRGNVLPFLRLVALGVPASMVTYQVRNLATGRKEDDKQSALDIRKLDRYLKALGTIPTDLITQAKFLKDTYNSPYATDIKKLTRTASSVLGPTVGEVGKLIEALDERTAKVRKNSEIARGKHRGRQPEDPNLLLKRMAADYIPFVGDQVKNTFLRFPENNKSYFSQLIDAIETGDEARASQILQEHYDPKTWKTTLKSVIKIVDENNPGTSTSFFRNSTEKALAGPSATLNLAELLNSNTKSKKTPQSEILKNSKETGNATVDQVLTKKKGSNRKTEIAKEINDLAEMAVEGVVPVADVEREIAKLRGEYDSLKTTTTKKGGKRRSRKRKVIRVSSSDTAPRLVKFSKASAPKPKKIGLKNPRIKLANLKAAKSRSSRLTPVRGRRIKIIK